MKGPTERTLKYLRSQGYHAQVVEKWNPFAKIRQDLFGWIDIVAVNPALHGVLGVQTTSYSNMSARMTKARGNPALQAWLNAGGTLSVMGWKRSKAERNRWVPVVWPVTMADLNKPVASVVQEPDKESGHFS